MQKYLSDDPDYDPLAICFGVRVKIESLAFNKITDSAKQSAFIDEHGTNNKLDFCESSGIIIPEQYYLLGIIYNHQLHLKDIPTSVKPLAIKLENLTIKNLIREIFS